MGATYIQWLLTALTGGLAGAVAKIIWDKNVKRPQGIGTNIDQFPVLSVTSIEDVQMKIVISQHTSVAEFENLYAATIDVENLGNDDLPKFKFGLDFTEGDEAIFATGTGQNRLHKIITLNVPRFSEPKKQIDFECEPFNRRDKYTVKTLITNDNGKQSPRKINIIIDSKFKHIDRGIYGS